MSASTLLKDTPIRFVQGEAAEFDLYVYDATLDEAGVEVSASRARSDLSSAVITMTVELADGTVVFTKVSSDTAQIAIDADQVNLPGKGSAIVKILAADTSALAVGTEYWHHTFCDFGDAAGRKARVVQRSRLYVDR